MFHLALGVGLIAGCGDDPVGPGLPGKRLLTIAVQQRGLLFDDRFAVVIDGGEPVAFGPDATGAWLPPGTHSVQLQGVAPNCAVIGTPNATASVDLPTQGALTFNVECWLTEAFLNRSLAWLRVQDGRPQLEFTRGTERNVGQDVRVLAMPAGHALHGLPSWSPDGEEIAVVTSVDDPNDPVGHRLALVRVDGIGSTVIAEGPYDLAWSPVGGAIAYTTFNDSDGTGAVWVAERGPEWTLRRLWDGAGGSVWSPAWSPDGQVLAVASAISGEWDIALFSADGEFLRKLLREGTYEPDNPAWSPDGRAIAYIRWIYDDFGGYLNQLHVLDLQTGEDVPIPLDAVLPYDVAWLPDGSGLVVQATSDRVRHLCQYVVSGGPPRLLVSCETPVYGFAASPR
jgi:hypothetical protein